MRFSRVIPGILLLICLSSCVRTAPGAGSWVPATGSTITPVPQIILAGEGITATPAFQLAPTLAAGGIYGSPTPDLPHYSTGGQAGPETYIVQSGDTLGVIANAYGISVEMLMVANNMTDPNLLSVGKVLVIPMATPLAPGPSFKILPDSELVYGPMSLTLDIKGFIDSQGGYLAGYAQDVDGDWLKGAQVVQLVAQNYSINPRLLLALLEYRSGWLTQSSPSASTFDIPMGLNDGLHQGLYRQLTWTANQLSYGYYLWKVGGVQKWVLADASVVPVDPTINPGTAGVQYLFSRQDGYATFILDSSEQGFFATYNRLFGNPFALGIEPIVPVSLVQPVFQLPFVPGEVWAFTGGPHGGWDSGSAWAALDFAPMGTEGCMQSDSWVTAVADGLVIRAQHGAVVLDLDGDGYEQTGWTVLYMHIESRDRVHAGTLLHAGDPIGHPSCEGGISNGTHVHIARRFNGEWIPADGTVPFNMEGWISSGNGVLYDGFLTRDGIVVEAYDGSLPLNRIER